MRYALRNQEKIKKHFGSQGDTVVNRMKKSLDKAFQDHEDIESIETSSTPYPTIKIPDVTKDKTEIVFFVIKKFYDVYTVAFKEFTNK